MNCEYATITYDNDNDDDDDDHHLQEDMCHYYQQIYFNVINCAPRSTFVQRKGQKKECNTVHNKQGYRYILSSVHATTK